MNDRINELLKYLQMSSAQFADIIGVQRSSISHILSGRNKPSFDFIHKILLKYPEINANWLITGQGSIKTNNEDISSVTRPINESDLFSQSPENKEKVNLSSNPEKPLESTRDVIKDFHSNENENTEITNVNRVKSIIVIYENDTFKYLNSI